MSVSLQTEAPPGVATDPRQGRRNHRVRSDRRATKLHRSCTGNRGTSVTCPALPCGGESQSGSEQEFNDLLA